MFILLFESLLFFPWWLSLVIALLYLFLFKAYEVVALGFIADSLFAVPIASFSGFLYVYTVLFIILFLVISILKKYIVYY
mgnify:CR=1 FL=1